MLLTPAAGNRVGFAVGHGLPWAADNSAFSGFREGPFVRMLDALVGAAYCLWVTAPDVVGDAAETLDLFRAWQPRIAARGLPVALVGQDGLRPEDVPWQNLDALFVGGSTAWKLSTDARRVCAAAKDRGKLVHVGRVNSRKRIREVASWGTVDTIDGSGWSRWPDARIPKGLRWIAEATATRPTAPSAGTRPAD